MHRAWCCGINRDESNMAIALGVKETCFQPTLVPVVSVVIQVKALKGNGDAQEHSKTLPTGLEPAHLGQWPSWLVPRFGFERQGLRCCILLKDIFDQVSQRDK